MWYGSIISLPGLLSHAEAGKEYDLNGDAVTASANIISSRLLSDT